MTQANILLLSILAALVPALLYAALIYWIDRYEKEPLWLLAATFLWGAVPSIIFAFFANTFLSVPFYLLTDGQTSAALAASFIAPPVEESIKGVALLGLFFFWRHEIDSILDGIIYGAMVGMGFAVVENVYYFMSVFAEGGIEAWSANVFIRGIIFGLNHSLFTSMTGLGIAVARMSKHTAVKLTAPLLGWFAAMFLHFIHNASVSFNNLLCLVALASDWGGVMLMLAIMIWAVVQEQRWITEYLADEVAQGTLTPSQYDTACSGRARLRHHLSQLRGHGIRPYRQSIRYYHRCSELAYKKHHFELFGDEKSQQQIDALRLELPQLAQGLGQLPKPPAVAKIPPE